MESLVEDSRHAPQGLGFCGHTLWQGRTELGGEN